jgi:hypothetical protein
VRPRCAYVLPLKAADADGAADLGAYLTTLVGHAHVIAVDGSSSEVFAAHRRAFPPWVEHIGVDPDLTFAFGKVNGVLTGLRRAQHDAVVIADDDVRYTPDVLRDVVALLDRADVVVPQNIFTELPWHARWDTARSLLNRAFGGDWPGTVAVRRSALVAAGGYDGDCLFENLELVRTIQAGGGGVCRAAWISVPRRPPTTSHFLSQRVRQAYDSFAQPWRLAVELAAAPALALAARRWGVGRAVAGAAAGVVAVAEVGRRRHGGRRWFPRTASLWAPAWVAERAVTSWAALGCRLVLGGVPYGGRRIRVAAHRPAELRAIVGGPKRAWLLQDTSTKGASNGRSDPAACDAVEGERLAGDAGGLRRAARRRRHQGEGHRLRA